MSKAIFFDWFYTLARFEPPRQQLYSQTFREFGVELSPEKVMRGILVADQYKLDVIGARTVGINPILIDRYDMYPEVSDCPRIHSLSELAQHL